MNYVIAIVAVIIFSAFLTLRGRKKKIQAMPARSAGFGNRDQKVIITFTDGTTKESTWGEVAEKVRELNGEPWWIEKKYDIVIGGIYCAIGLAATFVVYLLQMP